MQVLDRVVKTYDVRGLVATELTEDVVAALGWGFATHLNLAGGKFVIGHDMRDSSEPLAQAFIRGATSAAAGALELGLCATDQVYFASGKLNLPAVMFTASHNPASYNGIKFSRAGAAGISLDTGLSEIRDLAKQYLALETAGGNPRLATEQRLPATINLDRDYALKLRGLAQPNGRRLKVVVDAANGMAGHTVPLVLGEAAGLESLNLEIIPLYFELDGSFPNHEANPLEPDNLKDVQAAVLRHSADIGLAFDGDADRCFVVDELGQPVTPSAVTAIVARREIARAKAAGEVQPTVLHNLLTSRFVAETIVASGARPQVTRVGHSLIKTQMQESGAVFAGEHSAHYYFRDFWGADTGMLAALHVLAELAAAKHPLSELSAAHNPYFQSGELNSRVDDAGAVMAWVREHFSSAAVDELDGLTLSEETAEGWWWLNLRPSNTEPLLRLNVESNSQPLMARITETALALIRSS